MATSSIFANQDMFEKKYECLTEARVSGLFQFERKFLKDTEFFPDKTTLNFTENYTLLTDISGNETQLVTSSYGKATGNSIRGIPTTFLIDRDGFIRKKYVGPRSEKVFYNDLKPYL